MVDNSVNLNNQKFLHVDPDINFFSDIFERIDSARQSDYYGIEHYNAQFQTCGESHVTILNYNVRSFNANSSAFLSFLKTLYKLPDIIVISETWITKELLEFSNIDGYVAFHTIRP